ncbi:MAG: hypothetical protein AAB972_02080 [Patescibacteria group bacterium]
MTTRNKIGFSHKNISRLAGDVFEVDRKKLLYLADVAGVAVKFDGDCEYAKDECVPKPCERSKAND